MHLNLGANKSACCARQGVRSAARALPRPTAAPRHLRRANNVARVVRVLGAPESRSGPATSPVEVIRQELVDLEKERDAAVATAESCAQTSMKVSEMVALLEEMALEKLKIGDEAGAKRALQEKSAAKDVVEKSKTKAELNYALAARLATKIGERQTAMLTLLRAPTTYSSPPSAPPSVSRQAPTQSAPQSSNTSYYPPIPSYTPLPPPSYTPPPPPSMPTSTWSSIPPYSPRSSLDRDDSDYSSYIGSSSSSTKPQWQQDMEDKLKQVEKDAANRARAARLSAEDSIDAARDRLREREYKEDILTARDRLQKKDVESIVEAQGRLREQDAEVLQYVRSIMARYKRGEYVSDDELEFAFRQLEKRFT